MYENIILAVDLDGTLLDDESKVSKKNIDAINRFRENGGLFTIATGRAISYTRPIVQELDIDIPAIVYNGGMIRDFINEETLWSLSLPISSRELMIDFYNAFPSAGIDVMKGESIYSVSSNFQSKRHEKKIGVPTISSSFDDLPNDGWDKILIMDEKDTIDLMHLHAKKLVIDGIHITRSSPYYLEILPGDANKGNALRELIDICGYKSHFIAAAGDFHNDIEMLKEADHAFAVENAQDEVKKYADTIVCDNNSGAVHDIIEILKNVDI